MSTEAWTPTVTVEVVGTPQQRGSKIPVGKKGGGVLMVGGLPILKDANKHSRAWMDAVAVAGHEAWGRELIEGPVALSLVFRFRRPKSHYRTGRNAHLLKDSAPTECLTRRDLAKLIRSTEDALSKVIYADDVQVVEYLPPTRREYTNEAEGATIVVYQKKPTEA